MRLLIDERCSALLERSFRAAGADVVSVRSIAPGAADIDVMAIAFANERILVTHDYDLPELAVLKKAPCLGVVLIAYTASVTAEEVARSIALVFEHAGRIIGHVCIIEGERVRFRAL